MTNRVGLQAGLFKEFVICDLRFEICYFKAVAYLAVTLWNLCLSLMQKVFSRIVSGLSWFRFFIA